MRTAKIGPDLRLNKNIFKWDGCGTLDMMHSTSRNVETLILPWSQGLAVPSEVQIIRTNQIDLRVCKNMNQSAPKGQILTLLFA